MIKKLFFDYIETVGLISFYYIDDALVKIQHAVAVEMIVHAIAALLIPQDARVFEYREMFGDGRDVGADHLGELQHTVGLFFECIDNEQTGRVRHGFYDARHLVVFYFFKVCHFNLLGLFGKMAKECQAEKFQYRKTR
jgi:hypothetical protein